jgi:hypothetical protein
MIKFAQKIRKSYTFPSSLIKTKTFQKHDDPSTKIHTGTPEEQSKQEVSQDVETSSAQIDPTTIPVEEIHEELSIITM